MGVSRLAANVPCSTFSNCPNCGFVGGDYQKNPSVHRSKVPAIFTLKCYPANVHYRIAPNPQPTEQHRQHGEEHRHNNAKTTSHRASHMINPSNTARSVVAMKSVRRLKRQWGHLGAASIPSVVANTTANQCGVATNKKSVAADKPNPLYKSEPPERRLRKVNIFARVVLVSGIRSRSRRSCICRDRLPLTERITMKRGPANSHWTWSSHQ
jgi:hypothetical protein